MTSAAPTRAVAKAARPDTWMPLFWGDYRKDTADLGAAQHGAYLLLIGHYWTTGKPLPDDDAKLWRIAAADSRGHWLKLRAVLAPFFDVAGGVWHHARIEYELDRARRFIDRQSENGKRGGRPKKPPVNPSDNPGETTSPSPSPSPFVSPIGSVAGTSLHTQARPVPLDWTPTAEDLREMRKGRPDLVGAFYEQRLEDFRDWCRARAITSHDVASTWRAFMRKTHAAETPGESWEDRRKREFEEAIARGLA